MFAFLLNPGGRRRRRRNRAHPSLTYYKRHGGHRRRHKVVKHRRSHRRPISRSTVARRSYYRRRIGATKARYKSLARRLLDRYICAPGATRRWHAARARCPVKLTGAVAGGPSWEGIHQSVGYNSRRRRRRRRNGSWVPAYATNPRRRARFRYRRHNTSWVPSFAMNGLNIKSVGAGYSPELLMKGAVTLVGFVGNALVNKQLGGLGFMPSFLKSGPGAYGLGLATAGVTGALVGLVAPKYAISVVFGGVMQQIVKAYNEYVAPMASVLPKLGGFDDYATVQDIQNARPLGCLFGGCGGGMGNMYSQPGFDSTNQLFNQDVMPYDGGTGLLGMGCMNGNCMGDYLTPEAAAAARPLGALGRTMNDVAIEGTATEELGGI